MRLLNQRTYGTDAMPVSRRTVIIGDLFTDGHFSSIQPLDPALEKHGPYLIRILIVRIVSSLTQGSHY
jgi:hypothetical protein